MTGNHLSLILLSTLKCNAACEYCFEDKTNDRLDHEKLTILIDKVLDYMDEKAIGGLTIYWQGGEALLLPPSWYEQAYRIIQDAAESRHKHVTHALQTNMLTYSSRWNQVIAHMFGNSVGTSLDYPNLYRKVLGRSPDDYNALWTRKVQEARTAGIDVKVISVLNQGTLDIGAGRFYTYFVDTLQVNDFQVNTPFPGGESNTAKQSLPLDVERLSQFHLDLADIWIERGYHQGVKIGPFDELLNYFTHQEARLPCIWGQNCADEFVSIDARGYVAQCDCWVTSYPEYFYGNIFEANSFSELLRNSPARRRFYERPIKLMQRDCIECDYLSLCHGGCPVRTYTVHGSLFEKDPYCYLYKSLFRHMEKTATKLAARQAVPVREPSTLAASG
jgi:radical SAM protein with 4Fe4S-binding SPASM domain